jgi:hypothetical protein
MKSTKDVFLFLLMLLIKDDIQLSPFINYTTLEVYAIKNGGQ